MKTLIINSPKHGKFEVNYNDTDHELIKKYNWHLFKCKELLYCATNLYLGKINGKTKQKRLPMHRLIMNALKDQIVDHRDGNGLNNTRENLRLASSSQNAANTHTTVKSRTGFKGVYFCKIRKTYFTQIRKNGRLISAGRFKTKEEAANRYNELAIKLHGEFASINQL